MPTARELLEQADALMRRNRKRGKGRLGDVPTLAETSDRDATLAPTIVLPDALVVEAAPISLDAADAALPEAVAPVDDDPISLETLSDVPVLTDIVRGPDLAPEPTIFRAVERQGSQLDDEIDAGGDAFPASAAEAAAVAAERPPPAVLEQEPAASPPSSPPLDATPTPAAQATLAPAPVLEEEFILEIPPPAEEAPPVPAAETSPIGEVPVAGRLPPAGREWEALAEEIRMQVLQRLDLFTDTGLRGQLGARLQPIVDRASGQLIETISRELGELVRGYVAEAIEREIESWRGRGS